MLILLLIPPTFWKINIRKLTALSLKVLSCLFFFHIPSQTSGSIFSLCHFIERIKENAFFNKYILFWFITAKYVFTVMRNVTFCDKTFYVTHFSNLLIKNISECILFIHTVLCKVLQIPFSTVDMCFLPLYNNSQF